MDVIKIPGCNGNLAETQDEYLTLPVRFSSTTIVVDGEEVTGVPTISSAWVPSKKELEILNSGGYVELTVLGNSAPPVMINASPMEDV